MEKLIVDRYSLMFQLVCEAIGKEDYKVDEIMKSVQEEMDQVSREKDMPMWVFNVEFKVNGVELSFENIMKRYEELYSQKVVAKAKELLQSQLGEIAWKLNNIEEQVENIEFAVNEKIESQWK